MNRLDSESRKKIQSKGGKQSAIKRREYKAQREVAKMILSLNARECNFDLTDIPSEMRDKMSVGELMAYRQAQKALSPIAIEGFDTTSWKELRNTADGTPVQTVVADVTSTSAEDISLDEALAVAKSIEPLKKRSKQ